MRHGYPDRGSVHLFQGGKLNISFSSLLSIIDGLFCVVQKGSSISGNIREYRYSAGDRDIPDGVGRSGIRDGVHYTFAAAAGFIYIRSRF